jgi:uncharacterized ion transporter superfamily protein YfcC
MAITAIVLSVIALIISVIGFIIAVGSYPDRKQMQDHLNCLDNFVNFHITNFDERVQVLEKRAKIRIIRQ